jgi:hypothetical protein
MERLISKPQVPSFLALTYTLYHNITTHAPRLPPYAEEEAAACQCQLFFLSAGRND